MVNIGNRPILWHLMKLYSKYSFKDFILGLAHKGEIIKEYFYHYELMNSYITIKLGQHREISFLQSNEENDWTVTLANTGEKALKGARIKKIEKYINEDTFMLTYGDGLADIDINSLLSFHNSHGKIATVTGINPSSRFGELKINQNKVESFNEKPKEGSTFINGGFFVFNKAIFNYLSNNDDCDLEVGLLETLAKNGELMVYKHTGSWACMDNIRDMDYLNNLWNDNKAFWKVW